MKRLILFSALSLFLASCNNDVEITNVNTDPNNFISETTPLSSSSKKIMEGVYDVLEGDELLGSQVVVKWSRDRLSIFSGNNGAYIILEGGSLDSVLFFLGYWRRITNLETGIVNFFVPSEEGGERILQGDTTVTEINMSGAYGNENESAGYTIKLRYNRPFSSKVKQSNFYIMAHRGGGRNSDMLGVSENSLEMLNVAERFGSTGVEIDCRLSKDGVPFLYHDNDINLRLTQKGVIWGNIEDFTWPQLRTLITLRYGEKIPTLREALEYILEKTTLRTVWLDTKDVDVLDKEIQLQQEILDRAAAMGRDLQIYIGLPSEDVFNAFVNYPGHAEIESLCELTIDNVHQSDADVWAPRWTQGTQNDAVNQMHQEGRKAFVWTLDEENYIKEFINEGSFDGILSNYPSIVAFYYYIQE